MSKAASPFQSRPLPKHGERLGITTPDQWKRAAIMFDRLWVPSHIWIGGAGMDVHMLQEHRPDIPPQLTFGGTNLDEEITQIVSRIVYTTDDGGLEITNEPSEQRHFYRQSLRMVADKYSAYGFPVVPVYPSGELLRTQILSGNIAAYLAALDNIPVLDGASVSWDEVLEFRRDKHAVRKVRRLGLWLQESLKCQSIAQASDLIAVRIEDYAESLHRHGLKVVAGGLSALAGGSVIITALNRPLVEALQAGCALAAAVCAWGAKQLIDRDAILRGPNSEIAILYDARQSFAKVENAEPDVLADSERPILDLSAPSSSTAGQWAIPELRGALCSPLEEAMRLSDRGDFDKAEELARLFTFPESRVFGVDHPYILLCHEVIGRILYDRGKIKEAEEEHRQVYNIRAKQLGRDHPDTLRSRHYLALIAMQCGDVETAANENREILSLRIRLLGWKHYDVFVSRCNLANSLYLLGRLAEGETECRVALSAFTPLLGENHADIMHCRNTFGCILTGLGKFQEAETEHRKNLPIRESTYGRESGPVYQTCYNLALALRGQEKYSEASEFARRAYEGARARYIRRQSEKGRSENSN